MVSVIIPFYNEEKTLPLCLQSLASQSYKPLEIIAVDDGSTDNSGSQVKIFKKEFGIKDLFLLKQSHQGPGAARNLGVQKSRGAILVFVDADMVFERNFISDLVRPIEKGETIGTFSREEYLLNKDKRWAVCWNINRYFLNGWKLNTEAGERILPTYYPNIQMVFRAILRTEFLKVGGFSGSGYTDDWSLAQKLNRKASVVKGAKCYHRNPETLVQSYRQARWIGTSRFISGSTFRRLVNLLRYCAPMSVISGLFMTCVMRRPDIIVLKLIYDAGIFVTVLKSLFTG